LVGFASEALSYNTADDKAMASQFVAPNTNLARALKHAERHQGVHPTRDPVRRRRALLDPRLNIATCAMILGLYQSSGKRLRALEAAPFTAEQRLRPTGGWSRE
jgi:hypothetical protein